MSNRRRRRNAVVKDTAAQAGIGQAAAETPKKTGWQRFPIWVWVLIFVLPLVLSEYMFYVSGRTASMVLFPIAWIGFWATIWYRFRAKPSD